MTRMHPLSEFASSRASYALAVARGRMGDLWGRRQMMLVFFFGMGLSAIGVSLTQTPFQMGIALTVLGVFSAIYHPVGIPMLVQKAVRPGFTIGINGLAGNLGIALAALSTGFLVAWQGWRMAFIVPGLISIVCGFVFAWTAPNEANAPAKKKSNSVQLPKHVAWRTFAVMVATATTTSVLFNITTNGNAQLLAERLDGLVNDPARLGILLAGVYAVASLAQLVVGRLLDRFPVKPLFFAVLLLQIVAFGVASSRPWVRTAPERARNGERRSRMLMGCSSCRAALCKTRFYHAGFPAVTPSMGKSTT